MPVSKLCVFTGFETGRCLYLWWQIKQSAEIGAVVSLYAQYSPLLLLPLQSIYILHSIEINWCSEKQTDAGEFAKIVDFSAVEKHLADILIPGLVTWTALHQSDEIQNLYCPYFTEKHQGTRKYINKYIWIPTHYKQTKTLSENTKQWYKIIEYNVERKWQWNDLYTLWHIPQAIAAVIQPEDTEPDEGATAVKRYNRIDYELISHSYGTVVHYVPSR